ncbi:DNA-directed RNA polymerase III subunit RPC7 isoform X1 [Electrophorus electricus]|uniref:DNA-directed RNA polymerase III subunit RPC7 isoform X1 n=1 Tax=Electrophorus electricus TaxID=8005 RepID=UPI0015CFB5AA|nr:DNA-directed RNA polymerase III subunit RPC7 isoform X1 [Electrophorus electricus]
MAGKGRGVAAFTFNIEALGITRGSMPETQQGPRALFPQAEFKPVPLKTGEDEDYMLALKQEIRGRMKGLPFNIKPHSAKRNVERYKEKYTRECNQIEDEEWTPDWNRLPVELMPQNKAIRKRSNAQKCRKVSSKDNKALLFKLNELEKRGEKSDDEKEEKTQKKEDDNEEEAVEGEEYDEEELEEENDYIESYFEDGDDFAAGSDDNMDEATY